MKYLLIVLSLISITACSNQAAYENIQINQRNECTTLPPSQQRECMDAADKSYQEYERERQEILDDEAA